MKQCQQCSSSFEVTDKDRGFYSRMDIPIPDICPSCRMQIRMSFRNFYNLYHRKCDLTGKEIISMYDSNASFPVYAVNEWWKDEWDALDYGLDFDFSKSFFEQLKVLHNSVPRMGIMNTSCENSEYSNLSFESYNTYLIFGNVHNEDCCYGHIVWKSKNCFDCLYVYRSEECYECIDCYDCYNLVFSQSCDHCSDSKFLLDCVGCKDCFGCVGLKNKQYYIFGEPQTKEEYKKKIKEFKSGNIKLIKIVKEKIKKLTKNHVIKYFHGVNCENITGDYLYNCKNVFDSYDAKNCENSRYLATTESFFNSYDCNYSPSKSECIYNCVAVDGYHLRNCHNTLNTSAYMDYCDNCYASKNCLGCVGLKGKEYCILNKQYSKEEYEKRVPRIIEHMKKMKEWGHYFPTELSPFAYNETIACEYFPLSKKEAEAKGWRWKEMDIQKKDKGSEVNIPHDIEDTNESILKEVIPCEVTGNLFRIIPHELNFLKKHNLPIPRRSWLQRHKDRMALRNPRMLFDRKCNNCEATIKTTYSPERPEKVYCEECYLKEVY